jgi:hypothetical protein
MSTIVIKADKQSSKILSELAKKLGGNVYDLKEDQFEDLMLGMMMDSAKTGKTVSRSVVMKNLESGLKEVKDMVAGKKKGKTLKQLLDED